MSKIYVEVIEPLLFTGVEVEGIFKGKRTLFVQEMVDHDKIMEIYDKYKPEMIYFGARYKHFGLAPTGVNTFSALWFADRDCLVVIESTISSWIPTYHKNIQHIIDVTDIEAIFTNMDKYKYKYFENKIQFKFLYGTKIYLIPYNDILVTSKEKYEQDELVKWE